MFTDAQREKHPQLILAIESIVALGGMAVLHIHDEKSAAALIELGGKPERCSPSREGRPDYVTVDLQLPGGGYVTGFGSLSLIASSDPFASIPAEGL